jgi:hypothetical protein
MGRRCGKERAAVVGDDVARVVDGFWRPQLDYRQLTGRTLFAHRLESAKWARADTDEVAVTDSRFYEHVAQTV